MRAGANRLRVEQIHPPGAPGGAFGVKAHHLLQHKVVRHHKEFNPCRTGPPSQGPEALVTPRGLRAARRLGLPQGVGSASLFPGVLGYLSATEGIRLPV